MQTPASFGPQLFTETSSILIRLVRQRLIAILASIRQLGRTVLISDDESALRVQEATLRADMLTDEFPRGLATSAKTAPSLQASAASMFELRIARMLV
nr:hypothetical protein WS87_05110 [Burkholderia sp. MSMB0856]